MPLGVEVPPLQSRTVVVNTVAGLDDGGVLDGGGERRGRWRCTGSMTWDPVRGYGSHLEAAVPAPAPRWYLAEGSTRAGFQLFYLIQNPGDGGRDGGGAVPAAERGAGGEDVHGGGGVAVQRVGEHAAGAGEHGLLGGDDGDQRGADHRGAGDVSGRGGRAGVRGGARERGGDGAGGGRGSWRRGRRGRSSTCSCWWRTPGDTAAELEATYLLPDGTTMVKPYTVAPTQPVQHLGGLRGRAAGGHGGVDDGAVDQRGADPGGAGDVVAGDRGGTRRTTRSGRRRRGRCGRWATGEVTGPPTSAATYVLVANTSAWDGDRWR